MILVTGATGTIGGLLVPLLLDRGEQVRAMTRDPARIKARPGLEIVRADYDDPASLAAAVDGVDSVFLVTTRGTAGHDAAMISAAAGKRIVKLSAIGTGEPVGDQVLGRWHLEAEQLVRDSGPAWTILRPSNFASNALHWTDVVPNPTGNAGNAVIDPRDIAEVAAAVLISGDYDGRILTLTGPEALSVPEQAAQLSAVLGRPLTVKDTDPAGLPDDFRLGAAWVRAGHNAVLTGDVAGVLGRPPRSFTDWARDCWG